MKPKFILAALALSATSAVFAQQALNTKADYVSPEITNGYATFHLFAPKASKVLIDGDIKGEMKKGESATWTFTTETSLEPELYSYHFVVDSVNTLDPSNVYNVRDVATVQNMFIVTDKEGDRGWYYSDNVGHGHGMISHPWYYSNGENKYRRLTVYTPAGYETSGQNYPVLYLLHGMGGDETAWRDLGRVAQIMDNMIAAGDAKPMIVVMPNGNISMEAAPGTNPGEGLLQPRFQLPRTMDGSFETQFPEIVAFTDSVYRTIPGKSSRAVAGLSMGGFHALNISRLYPDLFDNVGLFSAATYRMKMVDAPAYENYEETLATQFAKSPKLYWIGIGTDDFLYDSNVEYHKELNDKGFAHEFHTSGGGHEWRNWRDYLRIYAAKIFK